MWQFLKVTFMTMFTVSSGAVTYGFFKSQFPEIMGWVTSASTFVPDKLVDAGLPDQYIPIANAAMGGENMGLMISTMVLGMALGVVFGIVVWFAGLFGFGDAAKKLAASAKSNIEQPSQPA